MRSMGALLLAAITILANPARADSRTDDPKAVSLKPLPDDAWDRAAAAHLLRRAAFGASPAEIDRVHALGLAEAVRQLVDYSEVSYQPAPPLVAELLLDPVDRSEQASLSPDERRRAQEERQRAERRTFEESRLYWLERLAQSPRPFEERMTLFWHGHFTSGMREVRRSIFMKEQNELLRRLALGNFEDFVRRISRDRAMLAYLDGNRNVARSPNENYARELLELFTLGVGNYSESDIKAAARAFTGWTFDESGFVFRRRNHDFGEKRFLGATGKFDGDDIIDVVLKQPAASRFLATQLLKEFVTPNPHKRLIEALGSNIRKNNYDLRPVLRTLLSSEAFYHEQARGSLVKSPVELLIGTVRALDVPLVNLIGAERALVEMGQELMQPPNVKGWDGGAAWINTATLFHRYNVVGQLIHGDGGRAAGRMMAANDEAAEASEDDAASPMTPQSKPAPRSRLRRGKQPAYDVMSVIQARQLTSARDIVTFYEQYLLARPLSDTKRDALVEYLEGPRGEFSLDRGDSDRLLRTMVHLMCSTPEYQMN